MFNSIEIIQFSLLLDFIDFHGYFFLWVFALYLFGINRIPWYQYSLHKSSFYSLSILLLFLFSIPMIGVIQYKLLFLSIGRLLAVSFTNSSCIPFTNSSIFGIWGRHQELPKVVFPVKRIEEYLFISVPLRRDSYFYFCLKLYQAFKLLVLQ